jgi:carbamoyl-phosphate synthase large subunit
MQSVGETMAIGRTSTRRCRRGCARWSSACRTRPLPQRRADDRRNSSTPLRTPPPDHRGRRRPSRRLAARRSTRPRVDPWFLVTSSASSMEIEKEISLEALSAHQDLRRRISRTCRPERSEGSSRGDRVSHRLRMTPPPPGSARDSPTARSRGSLDDEDSRPRAPSPLGLRPVYKRVDTCAAEFVASTPTCTRPTRVGVRSRADRPRQGHHSRIGAEPHRPGHRVRHLLRARLLRAAGDRLRDDHDQLQSRDGLHRLRHIRPALLRAAHARGRPRDRRTREARGRDRPVRRPDAAEAREGAREGGRSALGTSTDSIDLAEDRERFGELLDRLGIPIPEHGTAKTPSRKRSRSPRRIGFPVVVRPSYVLGGRAMATYGTRTTLRGYMRDAVKPRPAARSWSIAFSRTPSRSTSTRSPTATRRHRRRHAAHRGSGHSLRRLDDRDSAVHDLAARPGPDPPPHGGAREACSTSSG